MQHSKFRRLTGLDPEDLVYAIVGEGWSRGVQLRGVRWDPAVDSFVIDAHKLRPEMELYRANGRWMIRWLSDLFRDYGIPLFVKMDVVLDHPLYTPLAIARAVEVQKDTGKLYQEYFARVRETRDLLNYMQEDA